MSLPSLPSGSTVAASGFGAPQFVQMKFILPPPLRHIRVRKNSETDLLGDGRRWGMLKYANVRLRGRQMRVAYRSNKGDSSGSEIEWWFADLTDQEREQLCVTAREESAIFRQIREGVAVNPLNNGT
jgi:hypothetical protein